VFCTLPFNFLAAGFLFQQISVLIQKFNSVVFHETFPVEHDTDM